MSGAVLGLAALAEMRVHGEVVAHRVLPAVVLRLEVRVVLPEKDRMRFSTLGCVSEATQVLKIRGVRTGGQNGSLI